VAGIDEASARSVLAIMQDQLARDPVSALGVTTNATAEDLRAAFLELTKRFHPVRFGRMAVDIQKQSNEVFLALRAAHDALTKAVRRQSGPIPTARTAPSSPIPVTSPPLPTTPPANARGPLPPRPARASGANDTGERAPGSPSSAPPSTAAARPAGRPAVPQAATRSGPIRPVGGAPLITPRDEAAILDLLSRQQWDQARTALHQLSARDPTSKRVRALACFARGREAQLDGRVDDARVELHDALDLDPDLAPAKTALTELFTRRK
jgi:hypothetical protein